MAQRRGDVGRGQARGRDLVQQRLEQVMVAAVDQGDAQRRRSQRARRPQAAEAAADDHEVRAGIRQRFAGIHGMASCTSRSMREVRRVSGMNTYTASEHAMQAVTYQ